MNVEIAPKAVLMGLLALIAALSMANLGALLATHLAAIDPDSLGQMFTFAGERNVPTAYSALALLTCAILVAFIGLIYRSAGESYVLWLLLASAFLFVAFDEFAEIHERLGARVSAAFDMSGAFANAWFIPYGIVLAVAAVFYLRFLWRLPGKTRALFVISGVVFITGAVGFEMLGALIIDQYGTNGLRYGVATTVEETLEMLGVALFVYALLDHIVTSFEPTTVRFVPDNPSRTR